MVKSNIKQTFKKFKKQKYLQMMVLPWIVWLIIFNYIPMYGIIIAFKNFQLGTGIMGSSWVGFSHFQMFFNNPDFFNIMKNTLGISLGKLLIGFPAPIILALLLNELRSARFKKIVQSVSYLPHFISWVILSGMITRMLSSEGGYVNDLLVGIGLMKTPMMFLGKEAFFWPILILTDIWKGIGWGSIIYLAAISNINQNMYEAAAIDGANRLQRIMKITLPSIAPTIVILLIFSMSGILNAGFDQVYLLQNPLVLDVGEILDTYVYKVGIMQGRYSYSTAVGLFKSVVGFILIITTNWTAKKVSKQGIF